MRKGIILLAILLLGLGCISEKVEEPEAGAEAVNISEIVGHLEEYNGKEVRITGRTRGNPILIGEMAYADIEDGTGRAVIIFNPKKFVDIIDVGHGDKVTVRGTVRTGRDTAGGEGEIMAHIRVPYLIEATQMHALPRE